MYMERDPKDITDYIPPRPKELIKAFLDTSRMEGGANFAFCVIPSSPIEDIQNTHPLYYAASFGLIEVVKILVETEKDIDIDAL
jgi:hypothetical protein